MSEDLERKVVEMYRADVKVNKICADLDTTLTTLYRILHKHKVPLRVPKPPEREPRLRVQKNRKG